MNQSSLALIIGITSAFIFSLNAILVQQSAELLSVSQSTFFRGLITFLCLLPWSYKNLHQLFNGKSFYLWLRAFSGGIAVIFYLLNTALGSAAEAKALANIAPLFVAIMAYYFYEEKLSKIELTGLSFLSLGGMLLIFKMSSDSHLWVSGAVGAFFTGLAYLSLKQASLRFSKSLIVAGFSLGVMMTSLLYGLLSPAEVWITPKGKDYFWILGIGLTGLLGQVSLTYSHLYLKNAVASALTLLTLVFLVFYERIFFGIWPSSQVVVSYTGIFAGVILMSMGKKR